MANVNPELNQKRRVRFTFLIVSIKNDPDLVLRFRHLLQTALQGEENVGTGTLAKQARSWAKRGNVFMYFIAGAKICNPAAALSLIREVGTVQR